MIQRRILVEQLKIKYGFYENFNFEQTQKIVDEYLALYQRGLQIPSASNLTETERQYGDDLIILSAHFYIDLYLRTSKTTLFFLFLVFLTFFYYIR